MKVSKMFDFSLNASESICCPHCCDVYKDFTGIPHMKGVVFGPGVPESSTSGPGLMIRFECEEGHAWTLTLSDHSGGTWLSIQ